MSLVRVLIGAGFATGLAACESLPVDLPGFGGTSDAPAVSAPAPQAAAEREDPENGVAGAALCIASAFYLADAELMSEDQALSAAEVWTGILDVIPSTAGARQKAVDDAYGTLEALDDRSDQGGLRSATFQYSVDGPCADQAFQRDYLSRFGDPDLMQEQLEGGS